MNLFKRKTVKTESRPNLPPPPMIDTSGPWHKAIVSREDIFTGEDLTAVYDPDTNELLGYTLKRKLKPLVTE